MEEERRRQEQAAEEARKRAEEEERKRMEAEARRIEQLQEAEARRRAEEAERKRQADAARRAAEEQERARREADRRRLQLEAQMAEALKKKHDELALELAKKQLKMKDDGHSKIHGSVRRPSTMSVRRTLGMESGRIPDVSDEPKLASDFNPGDISQGSIELAAQRNHCARPARRAHGKGAVTKEYNAKGFYVVKLFKGGAWRSIVVDDRLFCDRWGRLKFAKSKAGEFWVPILEKAYAKYHGSFEAIVGGNVAIGLAELTSGVADRIQLGNNGDVSSGALFRAIKSLYEEGHLLGAGSPSGSDTDVSSLGIVQGHAYAILQVREESDANGTHQLVQLRNPWGNDVEWKGDWSDGDSVHWTTRMRQLLDYRPSSDDGVFWMSFDDFAANYKQVYVCRIFNVKEDGGKFFRYISHGKWDGETAGGRPNKGRCGQNPQFFAPLAPPKYSCYWSK